MNIPFIDLKSQYKELQPVIQERINRVLDHGQYIMGPEVQELEDKLAAYTNSKYCITTGSGTDSLLISLMALGISTGDEIITTPFTFISTAEVIVLLGAKPIFVDIDPETCNINASLIEKKITKKTKAIVPVSLYGQPSDMDMINEIAKRNGDIPVIEDAAQSFGATYKTNKSCNLSTVGCTSFFPSKILGCYGDGGAIFTNNAKIANACKEIREHGQTERFVHPRIGIGGRMDTIQCAIVLAKLESFDWVVKKRIEIGNHYNLSIDKINIKRVIQRKDRSSVFGQYSIFIENRKDFQNQLSKNGVPTAVYYPTPINEQIAYKNFCCPDCTPVAKTISKKVISIPMSPELKTEHQELVINLIKEYSNNE